MQFKELARKITKRETGKAEVNIAQTSEILKIVFQELAKMKPSKALGLIEKYGHKKK